MMQKKIQLLTLSLFLSLGLLAQSNLKGTVYTSDGQKAEQVNIYLKELGKLYVTDEEGNYYIPNVPSGKYHLEITSTGLVSVSKEILVKENQTLVSDFYLKENAHQLDEVILQTSRSLNSEPVTIGKIAVNPMELPQSISVINSGTIKDQQAQKLSDVIKNVNGVYLGTTRGSTSETFFARGYRFGSGNLYKNGLRLNTGSMPEVSSLEKVEILKGGAAILYGDVAPGGIVNLISKKPKFNFGGEINFRGGSYGLWKPSVDIYGPGFKNVALRLNGTYEKADSYRDKVQSEKFYINPSVLIKADNKTTFLFQADYLQNNFTPDFGTGSLDNTKIAVVPRSSFVGTNWQYNKTKQNNTSLNVKHIFNTHLTLDASIGYQIFNRDYYGVERVQAAANGDWARPLNRISSNEENLSAIVNLTGKYKTGKLKHNILAGIDADESYTKTFSFNNPKIYDTINILDPNKFVQRTDIPIAEKIRSLKSPSKSAGIYIQDLISLGSKINVLAGVRYSYQKAEATQTRYLTKDSLVYGTGVSNDAFSPRFGLVYKPTNSTSAFASYSNSFSINKGTDVFGNALPASIIDQYEVGVKNEFFNKKLSFNLTLYTIVNNNLAQTAEFLADGTTPNTNADLKELAGQTTSKGIELDMAAHPISGLNIFAGYSYNNMRYTNIKSAKGNYIEGERLVSTPEHTANASIFYEFLKNDFKGLKLGLTSQYVGNRLAGWNNKQGQAQNYNRLIPVKGFKTIDVSAGYEFKKYELLLKMSNLFNTYNYYVHENYSINPIAPRQIIGTLSYRF